MEVRDDWDGVARGYRWFLISSNGTEIAKSTKLHSRRDRAERSWNTFAFLAPTAKVVHK